ncbi:MAG: SOS response-associated peptidase [Balneolaceae bacterium]|nr:SOS response-associated peptidase [Balneolaceae bacterium]
MSDRFVLHAPKDEIEQMFHISSERDDYFESDYNITPGSLHPIIIEKDGKPQHQQAQWGLIHPDADEEREGKDTYAVPAEGVHDDDWLAGCMEQRRCLVPANGFYKWKTSKKKQTPFYIRLLSNRLTAFAGIYSVWESSSGRDVYSFAILTTKANTLVEPVDDRMPVILAPENYDVWRGGEPLSEMMFNQVVIQPFDLTRMAVNRVSEKVNDISNNSPELIQPIPK